MVCGSCGDRVELSARRARAARDGFVCRSSRQPSRVKVTPALRKWWLDRYSLEEIRELARGL